MAGATMAASDIDIDKMLREAFGHHVAGRLAQAEALYRQALAAEPRDARALHLLGVVAMQCGHFSPAVDLIRRAIAVRGDVAEFHANLGNALKQLGRLDEAAASYRAALHIDPDYAPALMSLGALLGESGRVGEAAECFRAVVRVQGDSAEARTNLAKALTEQGLVHEALLEYGEAVRLSPGSAQAYGDLLFAMHYSDRVGVEQRVAEHRRWAERHEAPLLERCDARFGNEPDPDRRLRIGYLSPDLKEHPVGRFMLPILERYDRRSFHAVCYSDAPVEDDVSAQLRAAAGDWHRTAGLTVEQLAALIRGHDIDVLVDLAGHTNRGRILALAHSPAPVRVTYLGYPGTTGMRSIQYRLTDSIADPPGGAEPQHSESLVRLDPCFLCYRVPPDAPAVAPAPPSARNGFVTFGSFNNLAKISPTTLSLWRRILDALPDARLLVKSRTLADDRTLELTRRRARHAGIDPSRVDLLPPRKLIVDHLSAYGHVDVALDTFPYHGTTTTCEALAMGVPVVTLAGAGHASRVGASLLNAVGLRELVAAEESAYVRIAVGLARDRERLATLRRELRERLARSPLCDEVAFTRRLESACRAVWRKWCEPAPAAHR